MNNTSQEDLQQQINTLKKEIKQLKDSHLQIVDAILKIKEMVTDIHSKPEPAINQLVLPDSLNKKKEDVTISNEKWLQEEGIPQDYFYIKDSFPTATIHYLDKSGTEKKVKDYQGYVYLGGDKSNNIPGKRFDISELTLKYFK